MMKDMTANNTGKPNVEKKKKRKKKGGAKPKDNFVKGKNESPPAKKDKQPNPASAFDTTLPTTVRDKKRLMPFYKSYLNEEKVNSGLASGELVKGSLRINQRNSQEAYIDNTASDGFSDYLILGIRDRNRALNGDVVVVKPKNRDFWVVRNSVFKNWKQENNIGCDFEVSLNQTIFDINEASVGSESVLDEDFEDFSPAVEGFVDETLLQNYDDELFVTAEEDEVSSIDEDPLNVSSDFFEDDDDLDKESCKLALEKLNDLRLLEEGTKKSVIAKIRKEKSLPLIKYDRKRLLRYRRRIPPDYVPKIPDDVKSNIFINDLANPRKARKPMPFEFLCNFDKNDEIPESLLIRTAEVVYISEKKMSDCSVFAESAGNSRARASGQLLPMSEEMLLLHQHKADRNDNNGKKNSPKLSAKTPPALFVPTDTRLPKLMISHDQLPKDFAKRPQDFAKFIFVAEMMDDWTPDSSVAKGRLVDKIGEYGDVNAEKRSLLMVNNIDIRPFPKEVLEELDEFFPLKKANKKSSNSKKKKKSKNEVSKADVAVEDDETKVLEGRRDFRFDTVFTIDPASARDLDDALHVKPAETKNGEQCWEVGVHIADVSNFVPPGGKVDAWARRRGTSVYLVDEVIPMLPRLLCEELCSLNPGVDRLTFSVVWKMDDTGKILEEWFGRSVIRSCSKLAYEHAQEFIENPKKEFPIAELPDIFFSNRKKVTAEDGDVGAKRIAEIRSCVLALNRLARQLRRKRFENGALRLDAPKLKIKFSDEGHKYPCGVCMDERSDANFLVEEFMLLANMSVAKRISSQFSDVSLLRRHPPPKPSALSDALARCERLGFPVGKSTSSKEISNSLRDYEAKPQLKRTVLPILFQYMLRSMQLAVYFCTGTAKSDDDYKHYALSVDRYTHFTSPIRRYPDLIVHRLLSACLGYRKKPKFTPQQVEELAKHCNSKKIAAKTVSDGSADIFFNAFIKDVGSYEAYGIVTFVSETVFEVILLEFGLTERVVVNKIDKLKSSSFEKSEAGAGRLTLQFEIDGSDLNIEIHVLSIVKVLLLPDKKPGKHYASIVASTETANLTYEDVGI